MYARVRARDLSSRLPPAAQEDSAMAEAHAEHPERSPTEAFASQVAHDIRNILNNFGLSLQFLELTLDLSDAKSERAVTRMRDEVTKLRRLVDELPARGRAADQHR